MQNKRRHNRDEWCFAYLIADKTNEKPPTATWPANGVDNNNKKTITQLARQFIEIHTLKHTEPSKMSTKPIVCIWFRRHKTGYIIKTRRIDNARRTVVVSTKLKWNYHQYRGGQRVIVKCDAKKYKYMYTCGLKWFVLMCVRFVCAALIWPLIKYRDTKRYLVSDCKSTEYDCFDIVFCWVR